MQYGRSMTEMLGILAIVGILSIVAISWVKTALVKNQANNLIEDVKLAGFLATDEMINSMTVDETKAVSGNFISQTNYNFNIYKESDLTFAVIADDIPERLCQEIKTRKMDWLEEVIANDTTTNACVAGDNKILFYFNDKINDQKSPDYCVKDEDCGECGKCEKRSCRYGVMSNSRCVMCDSSSKDIGNTTAESCRKCDNRVYNNGICTLCTKSGYLTTLKNDCDKCPQRYWTGSDVDENSIGGCNLCIGTVFMNGTRCDWDCPEEYIGGNQTCSLCQNISIVRGTTLLSCRQCLDHYFTGADETLGDCRLCSANEYIGSVRKSDCKACGNRYWSGTYVNDDSLGSCSFCTGTVSADGTQCITE